LPPAAALEQFVANRPEQHLSASFRSAKVAPPTSMFEYAWPFARVQEY
jgi:hypothetical protein